MHYVHKLKIDQFKKIFKTCIPYNSKWYLQININRSSFHHHKNTTTALFTVDSLMLINKLYKAYVIEISGETGNHLLKIRYSIGDRIQYYIAQKSCCIVSFNNLSSTQKQTRNCHLLFKLYPDLTKLFLGPSSTRKLFANHMQNLEV